MKQFLKSLLSNMLKIFWLVPIDRRKIVFRSSQGAKYNCNPKYITEYILEHCKDEFYLVWIFNQPQKYSFLYDKGVYTCKTESVASLFHLCTARIIIDNHGIQSYLPIRRGQITINTWHGGGSYKKGRKHKTAEQINYLKKMKDNTSYYVSSCKKFSDNNLADISEQKILPYGMARNDIFFRDFSSLRNKIRHYYELPEQCGIVLFAPTFRRMGTDTYTDINIKSVIEACEKKFQKEFYFFFRLHEFVEYNNNNLKSDNSVINVNDFDDMQELIAASDVIITDYSSIIWDAAISKKPCFIYATDLADYMDDRDFYTPIDKWPFPLAQNNKELAVNIREFDINEYSNKVNKHLIEMGSYERGDCADRIVQLIRNGKVGSPYDN